MKIYKNERKAVAKIMRRLYKQGLTTSSGGNVSIKTSDGFICITSSQCDKSKIKWQQIAVIDENGNNLTPQLKPSMEINIHTETYKVRKDISAIVHAHPIYATVFAISSNKIQTTLTGEARFIIGEPAIVEYELMGSLQLAKNCATALLKHDCAIMKNHGAICIGQNIYEAFDRMEVLEYTSKLNYLAKAFDNINILSEKQISEIDRLKNKI